MKLRSLVVFTLFSMGFILSWQLFAQGSGQAQDWKNIPLRDVHTGEIFRISDFAGKPILLQSFAVWCSTCRKQQQQLQQLQESVGDEVIIVSLDVDPNEDERSVRDHAIQNGFDWPFVVSPPELTQALINEFGTAIVIAPMAPIVLLCDDQQGRLLNRGVKKTDKLQEEIDRDC